jgi:two-component sensor histidine kinase
MSQIYKQKRLGWAVGKSSSDKFPENFYFVKVSLRWYPMYSQMAEILDRELRSGSADRQIVTSNYLGFINNCNDPALTEPLKKTFKTATQLQIGNHFPVDSFRLQDSSVISLEKFKGKPICLVLLEGPKGNINFYKDIIDRFSSDDMQFIFAKTPIQYLNEGNIDSTILKKQNVTYVNLLDLSLRQKLLFYQTKIFLLDKWFRIVENNAEDPELHRYKNGVSNLEKSLRKTIEAKRYSKAEKATMIKTAGWSLGSILFTFLVGLWIYRIRIRRIKTQEAAKRRIKELEIKAIRSQMNPHFIFNALNSIQSLINGNQFKEANIYLSKFAVLLRGVLNNSEKSRISLSDELQAVELYCQLEQLRFEFKFEISIDTEVDCDLIEIPGMIIQPLAENAVLHGLSGKGELGKLDIQVKRQNGNLCVCVSDNGVGLQTQKIDELSQKGFGLKLVEERINILNLDGKEAKLTVENQSDANGTVATLIIPID